MNKILSIAITLFFFATQVSAQAWADSTGFTAGAKIALHEIWGEAMGYSGKNETAKKAQVKYNNGNFVTITVLNTGVDANGKIKLLTQKTIQGVYLGNVDATPFGHPGCTVDLYLKKDCQNIGLANLVKGSAYIPGGTTGGTIAITPATTRERLIYSSTSDDGSYYKIYAEIDGSGNTTGHNRIDRYDAPISYDRYVYHYEYVPLCGCEIRVASVMVHVIHQPKQRVVGFGY